MYDMYHYIGSQQCQNISLSQQLTVIPLCWELVVLKYPIVLRASSCPIVSRVSDTEKSPCAGSQQWDPSGVDTWRSMTKSLRTWWPRAWRSIARFLLIWWHESRKTCSHISVNLVIWEPEVELMFGAMMFAWSPLRWWSLYFNSTWLRRESKYKCLL